MTSQTFPCYRNSVFLGYVRAVSVRQAKQRAKMIYGRCEVIALDMDANDYGKRDMGVDSRTHGRAPYATPGFEARRAALIEAHKANA